MAAKAGCAALQRVAGGIFGTAHALRPPHKRIPNAHFFQALRPETPEVASRSAAMANDVQAIRGNEPLSLIRGTQKA
jgi:hypothetical protein